MNSHGAGGQRAAEPDGGDGVDLAAVNGGSYLPPLVGLAAGNPESPSVKNRSNTSLLSTRLHTGSRDGPAQAEM